MNQPVVFIRGNKTGTNYDEERKKKLSPLFSPPYSSPAIRREIPREILFFQTQFSFYLRDPIQPFSSQTFWLMNNLCLEWDFLRLFYADFHPAPFENYYFQYQHKNQMFARSFWWKWVVFFLWCLSFSYDVWIFAH